MEAVDGCSSVVGGAWVASLVAVFGLLLAVSPEGAQGACTLATTTLTSNVTQTNANAPTATLTLKTSRALCSVQTMTVKDNTGLTVFTGSGPTAGAASYSISVTPPNKTARTYTSNLGGSVTVTNVGWNGTLTLTPASSTTTANAPAATLTLTMSKQIVSPYFVCLYDESGVRVLYSSNAAQSGTVFTLTYSAQPPNLAAKSYRAYVATTCPTTGVPGAAQGLAVASASVSVTNVGWDGTLSLAASPSSTDANAPSSTLTATMSKQIVSPYFVCIYDEANNQVLISSNAASNGTAFSVTKSVTIPNKATKTYTAVVATSCPPTGPATGIAKTSAAIPVMNQGWNGTLTLTADPSVTDANSPSTTLTARMSKQIVSPYLICIYSKGDQGRLLISSNALAIGPEFVVSTSVNLTASDTVEYAAFVAESCPLSVLPGTGEGAVRESSVTVEDLGWLGHLTLRSDRMTANPTAVLTLNLDRPLVAPYLASLYDGSGNLIWNGSAGAFAAVGSGDYEASVTVSPPATGAATYVAFVSQAPLPTLGPPTNDLTSAAGVTFVDRLRNGDIVNGVDIAWLEAELSGLSDEEIGLALSQLLVAPHMQRTSTSDLTNLYLTEAQLLGRREALKRVVAATAAVVAVLVPLVVDAPTKPDVQPDPNPPPPPPQPPPTPRPWPPVVIGAGTIDYTEKLALIFLQRKPSLNHDDAETAAKQCIAYVDRAIKLGILSNHVGLAGKYPCEYYKLFFPGSTPWSRGLKPNPPASPPVSSPSTAHYAAAITNNPAWIRLNWVNETDRDSNGLTRGWYASTLCGGNPAGANEQCDEYPFYSSAQSGPASFVGPPGASLLPLAASDNGSNGGRWRGANSNNIACPSVSGGPIKATATSGTSVLVIPLPYASAPYGFSICGAGP